MDNEEEKVEALEQLLRDERTLRIRAETRATEQAEKASVWRTRAEERAERIDRILAEPRRRRRRRAQPAQPTSSPSVATPISADSAPPAHRLAAVRVAAAVEDANAQLLAPFALVREAPTRPSLAEADVVVIDEPNRRQLEAGDATAFAEWLGLEGRQPLVLLADATTDPTHEWVAQADLVVAESVERFDAAGLPTMPLVPAFDPAVDNPIGWVPAAEAAVVTPGERDGVRVLFGSNDVMVGIEAADLTQPPAWLVAAAARGVPIVTSDLDSSTPLELNRASTAARRWAYRHHMVTVRATEMARSAGLDIRNPQPHVAAVLVSMRPDRAAAVLDMLRHQSHQTLSIVVGLHGVQPTPRFAEAVERIAETLPTVVLDFPGRISLGECLNRAIDATGAEILAKIDDDDFYGPAHIEDGVHTLRYSRAGIVGKGAQFTYVEAEDNTVLRRHREQETFLGGSPTGATMLIRRNVWEQVGFPHRPRQVDVLFTRAARHNGAQVYSGSPWEFCYVRSAEAHTWTTAAETFLAGAAELWSGLRPEWMVAPDLPIGPART